MPQEFRPRSDSVKDRVLWGEFDDEYDRLHEASVAHATRKQGVTLREINESRLALEAQRGATDTARRRVARRAPDRPTPDYVAPPEGDFLRPIQTTALLAMATALALFVAFVAYDLTPPPPLVIESEAISAETVAMDEGCRTILKVPVQGVGRHTAVIDSVTVFRSQAVNLPAVTADLPKTIPSGQSDTLVVDVANGACRSLDELGPLSIKMSTTYHNFLGTKTATNSVAFGANS